MAKTGRPTKYKKEYCERLIEHMENGYSFESFAGLVNVCKETIYTWTREHSEFLDAKNRAFEKSRLFWEKQNIEGLYKQTEFDNDGNKISEKSINSTVLIFNMKNRFPEEWRDKQTVEHEGNPDKPIAVKNIDISDRIDQLKGKK